RMARVVAGGPPVHQARPALVRAARAAAPIPVFAMHLTLRPTDWEHAEAIQRLAGHPDIAAMTPIPYPYPDGGAERFIRNVVLPGRAAGTFYGFAMVADGALVGHIGLKHVDRA